MTFLKTCATINSTMAPITFGLIGLGYFGKRYVRLLREIEGVELAAVADISRSVLDAYAGVLPDKIKRVEDAHEVLQDARVQCVVIALPASLHFTYAKAAIEAGKHVLVEKPMVTNLDDASLLESRVRKSGRIFMVGHQYLYNDHVNAMKRYVDEGALGKIRYVACEQMCPGPVRFDIGCVWERATHELAIIDYLFSPGRIIKTAGGKCAISNNAYEDFASFQARFESRLLAAITVSWFAPEKTRKMIVAGDCGILSFDDVSASDKIKLYRTPFPKGTAASVIQNEMASCAEIPKIIAKEPLRNQLDHFIECVRNRRTPRSDVYHGIRVTEYLDTVSRSLNV